MKPNFIIIGAAKCGTWDICRYKYQLIAYEELFTAENICVSLLEDWKDSKESEVQRIMMFLGLDPAIWQPNSPEKANRGSERTIERPLLKKLRTNSQVQAVVKSFPSSWRNWARMKFTRSKVATPAAWIAEDTKTEFINHVTEDSQAFLNQYGKNLNLWNGITSDNSASAGLLVNN